MGRQWGTAALLVALGKAGAGIWDLGWGLSMRAREMLPGLGSGDLGVGNILCLECLRAGVPCCATPWRRWVLPP